MAADGVAAEREFLPRLDLDNPERQRRLTVLIRVILLIPQFIVVWALGVAASVVTVIGWFGALFMGRLPTWAADYLSGYLAWVMRVSAYGRLIVDSYPPFEWSPADPAVRVELRPARLNRLAVLFRIILAIPAAILYAVLTYGWGACAFFCWLAVLIMGRTPEPLFGATAAVTRYELRYQAYWMMLTSAYPKGLFGEGTAEAPAPPPAEPEGAVVWGEETDAPEVPRQRPPSDTSPLTLTSGGKWLLIVFIIVGVLALAANATTNSMQRDHRYGTSQVY
ncbi:MAG TPA: DUF4389 domain-containing protein [Streptosporangiaceae bacterium]|jgi:hypothetical protein